jgi:translation initiation factor 2D
MVSLWESSSKPKLQAFQPPPPISPLSPNPNQVLSTEAGPSRPRSNSISAGTTEEREEGLVPSLEDLDISEPQPQVPKQNLSSSEISTLLTLSLLQSLQSPPSLPIPASLLYSAHILPNRPSYIPVGNRDEVVISKSDWKKLGKWMKEVSKDGLIKIKETKGEVIVISYVPPYRLYLRVSPTRWGARD